MIRLVVRGPVEPVAAEFAKYVAERGCDSRASLKPAQSMTTDARVWARPRVLSPAEGEIPLPDSNARGRRRQASGGRRGGHRDLEPPDDVQWIVDVDPVDMLWEHD